MGKVFMFYVKDRDYNEQCPSATDLSKASALGDYEAEYLLEIVSNGLKRVKERIDNGYQCGIAPPDSECSVPFEVLLAHYQGEVEYLVLMANIQAAGEALRSELAERIIGPEIPF